VLPEGITFLGENTHGSILYYRRAYARLQFEITGKMCTIITGTPGIGKTLFGLALVCEASMRTDGPRTNVVYHSVPRDSAVESTYFIFVNDRGFKVKQRRVVQSPIVDEAIFQLLQDPGTLFIVDGGFQEGYIGDALRCTTIQIISPDRKRLHGFEKEGQVKRFLMPLWEDEEMFACRTYCYPHIEESTMVQRQYSSRSLRRRE
jgi:hypothetical protein